MGSFSFSCSFYVPVKAVQKHGQDNDGHTAPPSNILRDHKHQHGTILLSRTRRLHPALQTHAHRQTHRRKSEAEGRSQFRLFHDQLRTHSRGNDRSCHSYASQNDYIQCGGFVPLENSQCRRGTQHTAGGHGERCWAIPVPYGGSEDEIAVWDHAMGSGRLLFEAVSSRDGFDDVDGGRACHDEGSQTA